MLSKEEIKYLAELIGYLIDKGIYTDKSKEYMITLQSKLKTYGRNKEK